MPELPEVETVARGLNKIILGEVVKEVKVLRDESVGHPTKTQFERLLKGHAFENATRRGKYIVIDLSHGAKLVVHLRMSGRLVVRKKFGEPSFLRVRILLESGRELHYEDMRVFGRLWYVPQGAAVNEVVSGIGDLGVEPLTDLTAEYLHKAFKKKSQPIKNTLLDQRIIAGIGNIYADESLFLSGINPLRPASSLKKDEIEVLVQQIIKVLERAIELGGSSLRDYSNLEGVNGNYQDTSQVYGREGEKCKKCKTKIERTKLAGRSSHYCPKCQPVSKKILDAHNSAAEILSESRKSKTTAAKKTAPRAISRRKSK